MPKAKNKAIGCHQFQSELRSIPGCLHSKIMKAGSSLEFAKPLHINLVKYVIEELSLSCEGSKEIGSPRFSQSSEGFCYTFSVHLCLFKTINNHKLKKGL